MRKTLLSIAGVAAAFAVIPLAQADDTAQLRAELAEVRARMQQDQATLAQVQSQLSQFRQDQSENWLSERRAEEVKSLIHEVLSDADTRATLLQDSMTAGHDGRRFFLASADGSFRMNINGQLQFRYIYNNRNDATGGAVAGQDDTMGFQFRRSKLTFSGHIGDPRIQYSIRFTGNRGNGNASMEEATIRYKVADWLTVYGGRLKAPFSRDELMSSSRQMAVERSVVDNQFSWARTEGVGFVLQPVDMLRINTMINNGPARNANDFSSGYTTFAVASRAELLLMGTWNQFRDYSSWAGDDLGVMLGGAVGYVQDQQFANNPSPMVWGNSLGWTVDAGIQWNGLSLAAAGYGQSLMFNNAGNAERYGALGQVGYNINDTIEPYVRYDYYDATDLGFAQEQHILTVGANYFLKKHSAKFTMDVIYLFEGSVQTGTAVNTGQGLLPSTSDQFAIRAQFQLLF